MPIDPFTGQELDPVAALAQQLGLPMGPGVPAAPQGPEPVQPVQPVQPDAVSGVAPNVIPFPAQPPTGPAPLAPAQPQGPQGPGPSKTSTSDAYGVTGLYDPRQFQRLGRDADKRTAGPIARAAAETSALATQQAQRLGDAYNALDAAGIPFESLDPESQAEAQDHGFGPGSTLSSMDLEALNLSSKKKVLDASFAASQKLEALDRAAHEISMQEVKGARARMEQQLAANRALSVDPTLNFTAGQSLGNAASLFAQGFLAAGYGIQVDASGTLDRWTDRYVQNQMEKIRRGDALAEQDRAIWDMVRTEAADEQDARDRLALFAKDQAATALEIEAARWGSPMMRAKGQEAAAQARIQLATQWNQMETGWYDRFQQQKNQIQEQELKRQGLAIEGMNARTARMAEERQGKAQENAQGNVPLRFGLDPGRPAVAAVRPEFVKDETTMRNLGIQEGNTERIVHAAQTLKEMQKKYGAIPTNVSAARALLGDDAQLVLSARADLFTALRDAAKTGANLTNNEVDIINDQAGLDTWINRLTETGSDRVLDALQNRSVKHLDDFARPYLMDPRNPSAGWDGSYAPQLLQTSQAGVDNTPPETSQVQSAQARVLRPTGHNDTAEPASDWDRAHGVPVTDGKVPDWSQEMQYLATVASDPNDPDYASAVAALNDIADKETTYTDPTEGEVAGGIPARAAVARSILRETQRPQPAPTPVDNTTPAPPPKLDLKPLLQDSQGNVQTWTDGQGGAYVVRNGQLIKAN